MIASTEAVRAAFSSKEGGDVKAFTPQLTLNLGTRISQVAFSSDESFLVLSAENGGGLAVYDTNTLLQGSTQSAFELGTGGVALRALVPNPSTAMAHLLAVVTANGELMVADMKNRQFVNTASGQVLKSGVSCLSWSKQGKQLVAGLGDGSAAQMTPEGVGKAEFPKPNNLDGDQHVSAILWLENDVILVAYTPSSGSPGRPGPTAYHIILRNKDTKALTFRKLPEVCSPFGLDRSPPFQFMQRLREWEPDLRDLIIVASTASSDVGLFSKSAVSFDAQAPQDQTVDVFTTTQLALDSRRAQLPMVDMNDTSPIGMALDLSSKSGVIRPLPSEDIEETSGPLPGLMIMNNEGILLAWWIVYADSVRRGTHYPGLAAFAGQQQTPARQSVSPPPSMGGASATPAFGQSTCLREHQHPYSLRISFWCTKCTRRLVIGIWRLVDARQSPIPLGLDRWRRTTDWRRLVRTACLRLLYAHGRQPIQWRRFLCSRRLGPESIAVGINNLGWRWNHLWAVIGPGNARRCCRRACEWSKRGCIWRQRICVVRKLGRVRVDGSKIEQRAERLRSASLQFSVGLCHSYQQCASVWRP